MCIYTRTLLCSAFLLCLAGCTNRNEPPQEQRPWDNQKDERVWKRSKDTVGGVWDRTTPQERKRQERIEKIKNKAKSKN